MLLNFDGFEPLLFSQGLLRCDIMTKLKVMELQLWLRRCRFDNIVDNLILTDYSKWLLDDTSAMGILLRARSMPPMSCAHFQTYIDVHYSLSNVYLACFCINTRYTFIKEFPTAKD